MSLVQLSAIDHVFVYAKTDPPTFVIHFPSELDVGRLVETFLSGFQNAEKIQPFEIDEVIAAAEGEAVGTILLIGNESHAVLYGTALGEVRIPE